MPGARAVAVRVALAALAAAATAWALAHYGAVYVGGESMAPALRQGDLAVYRRNAERVDPGDVVWVAKAGWPRGVVHRVQEVRLDGGLVLRGDANPVSDLEPVEPDRVRGLVVLVVPTGRVRGVVEVIARMLQSHAT